MQTTNRFIAKNIVKDYFTWYEEKMYRGGDLNDYNGIEFLQHIGVSEEKPYSIIVLSGHAVGQDISNCYDLGVRAFLRKPFNIFELKGLVKQCVTAKRVESELRDSSQRLRLAQQVAKLGFFDWDLQSNAIFWSAELYQLYGHDPNETQATLELTMQLIHPDDLERVHKHITETILGIAPYNIEHRILREDRRVLWVLAHWELFNSSDGKPMRFLGTVVDITEKKDFEKRMRASEWMASVGRMAAGLAHEVNNPLASVSLNLHEMKIELQKLPLNQEIENYLTVIERNLHRSSQIITEVLHFSGQSQASFIPLDINDVIELVLESFQLRLEKIKLHLDLKELPDIDGIFAKLEQFFFNIFDNALDAMVGEGSLEVISFHDANQVIVEIQDSGHGIPDALINKVFDPFFTTKPVGKGIGLGLSVCYGIIQQHNGTLDITSTPKKGTRVTVSLPIKKIPS